MRTAELGLVHRHELHGALHGLFRVRSFTQDDAHIFMLPSQMKKEITGVLDLFDEAYKMFGLPYHVELSTRPENSMGSDEIWDLATQTLKEAIEKKAYPIRSTKATAHSTVRNLTSMLRILSAVPGNAVLFSSICSCRNALI